MTTSRGSPLFCVPYPLQTAIQPHIGGAASRGDSRNHYAAEPDLHNQANTASQKQ
jgi:hypothetical protein